MDGQPEVRASWLKLAVTQVNRLASDESDRVLAALGPERNRIDDPGLLAWLSIDRLTALDAALEAGLGEVGALRFWSESMRDALHRPLLRPITSAALSIDGRDAFSLLKRAPVVHQMISRGCGELEVTRDGDTGASVELAGLPDGLRSAKGLVRAYRGLCDALVTFVGHDHATELDLAGLDGGCVRIVLRWSGA